MRSPPTTTPCCTRWPASSRNRRAGAAGQRRFPDYFFGQIALAHEQLAEGALDAAKKTLGKLAQRSKLHFSEYAALGECYIRIAVESGDVDEARGWLQRIEGVYPDYHALESLRCLVARLAVSSRTGEVTPRARFLRGIRT